MKVSGFLDGAARWILWVIALFVMVVIPWFFGGMGPEGYWFTVWAGRACLMPLGLWAISSCLLRRRAPAGFWVAIACWGLLAVQVWVSFGNPSHAPRPPWEGAGFGPINYDHRLPSTVFPDGTQAESRLWLSYALFALTAYAVGLGRRQWLLLLWIFAANVSLLAVIGIPFKYSGDYLMLGRWKMPESYFYSTFTYHNHWCAFALLGLAAGIEIFVRANSLIVRVVLAMMMVGVAVSAPISVSRLGSLIIAAYLGFVAVVWLKQSKHVHSRSIWRRLVIASSVLMALAFVGGAVVWLNRHGPGAVGQRNWSYIFKSNPFYSRIKLVEDSVPMVMQKPAFGWGLGSFGTAFRDFQSPETIVLYNEGRETRYEHCHNDWMERLVELGFCGVILAIIPCIVWCRCRAGIFRVGVEGWCVAAGIAYLFLFALGDMVFVNRCVAGISALIFGFLFSHSWLESKAT